MSEPRRIRDAARALRGDLADLGLGRADDFDRAVADLLAEGQAGADIDDDLLELLREDPRTRAYTAFFLETGWPPLPDRVTTRGETTLSGDAGPIPLARFSCPMGDYDWYRRSVGQPAPRCQTHNLPLNRAE